VILFLRKVIKKVMILTGSFKNRIEQLNVKQPRVDCKVVFKLKGLLWLFDLYFHDFFDELMTLNAFNLYKLNEQLFYLNNRRVIKPRAFCEDLILVIIHNPRV